MEIKNYALSLLAKRPFAKEELKRRLLNYLLKHKKEITPEGEDLVKRIVAEMAEIGLLNDKEFTEQFINHSLSFRKKGILTIRRELKRKGIAKEIIEEGLKGKEKEEEAVAIILIKRYKRRYEEMARKKNLRGKERWDFIRWKLQEILLRRGFSFETINKIDIFQ